MAVTSENWEIIKNVVLHTITFLITGLFSSYVATNVAIKVVEVRQEETIKDVGEIRHSLQEIVELQKMTAASQEWMRATDKIVDSLIVGQKALVEQVKDRYTRTEAKSDFDSVYRRINGLHDK